MYVYMSDSSVNFDVWLPNNSIKFANSWTQYHGDGLIVVKDYAGPVPFWKDKQKAYDQCANVLMIVPNDPP